MGPIRMRVATETSNVSTGSGLTAVLLVGGLVAAACTGDPGAGRGGVSPPAIPTVAPAVVSDDPYRNADSYHRTQGEPDSFAFGSTIVSAFMVGYRATDQRGGAANLGWSVSSDAGRTWRRGFLPGTSTWARPPGPWIRLADPSVAYDQKHDTWLIVGLGGSPPRSKGALLPNTVFVSRSTDGPETFGEPVIVAAPNKSQFFDKTWITCDNTRTSPYYGRCYVEWDDEGHDLRLYMSTSTDGGLTWTEGAVPRETHVIDGQPLVQPDGTVIMPIMACCSSGLAAFVSTDGGRSYTGPGIGDTGPAFGGTLASDIRGDLAVFNDPQVISADIDATGKVYVIWSDCRFRDNGGDQPCAHNDIMMATTDDGVYWSPGRRIPIDPQTSSVDHFLPAIAVDPATSGASARIGIVYYFYPQADCDVDTCELSVGFVSSTDGGSQWRAQQLADPFRNDWLPPGENGYRHGDYFAVSFVNGQAVPVFTAAGEGRCELGKDSCHTWIASATISFPDTPS